MPSRNEIVNTIGRGYKTIQSFIGRGKQAVKFIHSLENIPEINDKVKKITNNKNFQTFEKALDIADKVDSIIKRTDGLELKNIIPHNKDKFDNMNKIGIEHAKNRHYETVLKPKLIGRHQTDQEMADNIVANIR